MNDTQILEKVTELLKEYNGLPIRLLAETVASVCEVKVDEMLSANRNIHNTHARYLYWYAIRYLTHDSNFVIANTSIKDKIYASDCVRKGISVALKLIDKNVLWKRRWIAVKQVISQIKKDKEEEEIKKKIVVFIPEGVEVRVQKQ